MHTELDGLNVGLGYQFLSLRKLIEKKMTALDKNYLLWLLKEIQKSESLWKDELGYAVKLIQQKKEDHL